MWRISAASGQFETGSGTRSQISVVPMPSSADPHDAESMDDIELAMCKGLARKKRVVAIGEIGLGFHYDHSPRDIQREWFRRQIRMANQLKMPIVIHSREADQETMDILKEEGAFSEERKSWFPKRPDPSGYTLKKKQGF